MKTVFRLPKNSNVEMEDDCSHCGKEAREMFWKFLSPLSNILLNAFARKENAIHQRALEEKRLQNILKKTNKRNVAQSLFDLGEENLATQPMEVDDEVSVSQLNFNPMPHRKLQIFSASR